jgi:hypothetical protein
MAFPSQQCIVLATTNQGDFCMLRIDELSSNLEAENIINNIPALLAKAGIENAGTMEEAYKYPFMEKFLNALDNAQVFTKNPKENRQLFIYALYACKLMEHKDKSQKNHCEENQDKALTLLLSLLQQLGKENLLSISVCRSLFCDFMNKEGLEQFQHLLTAHAPLTPEKLAVILLDPATHIALRQLLQTISPDNSSYLHCFKANVPKFLYGHILERTTLIIHFDVENIWLTSALFNLAIDNYSHFNDIMNGYKLLYDAGLLETHYQQLLNSHESVHAFADLRHDKLFTTENVALALKNTQYKQANALLKCTTLFDVKDNALHETTTKIKLALLKSPEHCDAIIQHAKMFSEVKSTQFLEQDAYLEGVKKILAATATHNPESSPTLFKAASGETLDQVMRAMEDKYCHPQNTLAK